MGTGERGAGPARWQTFSVDVGHSDWAECFRVNWLSPTIHIHSFYYVTVPFVCVIVAGSQFRWCHPKKWTSFWKLFFFFSFLFVWEFPYYWKEMMTRVRWLRASATVSGIFPTWVFVTGAWRILWEICQVPHLVVATPAVVGPLCVCGVCVCIKRDAKWPLGSQGRVAINRKIYN